MCIYLFCNFSEEFNCKGNVKSMYSEYASGIAFLIKNKLFNQMMKGLPLDRVCAVGILTDCLWCLAKKAC